MSTNVYSVYDSKADAFLPPFIAPTDQVAIRMVTAEVLNDGTNLNRFPGDYTLFALGEWKQETGELIPYQAHKNIGSAMQMAAAAHRANEMTQTLVEGGN